MYIAIVDDLQSDRAHLKDLLIRYFSERRIAVDFLEYGSGEAFLEAYRPGLCSALFLDIVMGTMSGITVAEQLRRTDAQLPIILTTGEKTFALEGFRLHVMDYLTKPVDPQRLEWCLGLLVQTASAPVYLEVREISSQGASRPVRLPLDDILYLRSEGHNVLIRTLSSQIRVRSPFREVIAQIPQNGRFCECGRGIAVNFEQCAALDTGAAKMKNGEVLQFSLRQQEAVEQAYMRYIFSRTRKGGAR